MNRFFEILPGFLSWGLLLFLAACLWLNPLLVAFLIITYDFYWVLRVSYLMVLLIMAHYKLQKESQRDWTREALQLNSPHGALEDLTHAILFPVYQEPCEILEVSLKAVLRTHYDHKKVIIILAVEERAGEQVIAELGELAQRYSDHFREVLLTRHPDRLPGEARVKGANVTWAAQRLTEWLDKEGIARDKVIVSCFDADTVCHPNYLACLSYSFLSQENPHQTSYQPIPVYHNNIWQAPSFARVVEASSSFWQMIQSMRHERFVTFSSHSLSLKTLIEIGYWPVDMVSDDSAVFWKAFLHFDGRYRVIPMPVTVSMNVAFGEGVWGAIVHQYKQKRRWAWGIENFPFVCKGFLRNPRIPLSIKFARAGQLLEEHFTWATWAIILTLLGPLSAILGKMVLEDTVIGFNLPVVTGFLLGITSLSLIIFILASFLLLPPKPKGIPRYRLITMCTQWLLIPVVSAIIGSPPALDAQTRLMFGHKLAFWTTPKKAVEDPMNKAT